MSEPTVAREIQLTRRPSGPLRAADFRVQERQLDPLAEGQFTVRNSWLSIDAVTILRVGDTGSGYLPELPLDRSMEGWAVGEVVESRSARFPVGVTTLHNYGWRDLTVFSDDANGWGTPEVVSVDDERTEPHYLGALGPGGLTAWAGLLRVAELREGDVVFVSAAAGAVGGLVVQLAKQRGHTVVASAGSAEKVRFLTEQLGVDRAFCYRDGSPTELLREAAPDGIDVYFDNVGGSHLEAALALLRQGGRVALCGAISTYAPDVASVGPRNLFDATAKGLTLRGFLARMYADDLPQCRAEMSELVSSGHLVFPQHVYDGLEQAPAALVDLLAGQNIGKVLVRV